LQKTVIYLKSNQKFLAIFPSNSRSMISTAGSLRSAIQQSIGVMKFDRFWLVNIKMMFEYSTLENN
jgi:hypothetical protein